MLHELEKKLVNLVFGDPTLSYFRLYSIPISYSWTLLWVLLLLFLLVAPRLVRHIQILLVLFLAPFQCLLLHARHFLLNRPQS